MNTPPTVSRRCAVIYNPTKVSDKFHALVEESLQQKGWGNTLWLETSAEDPGRAMTKQAVAEHVDLVIGAGGDGTIRYVADSLALQPSRRPPRLPATVRKTRPRRPTLR